MKVIGVTEFGGPEALGVHEVPKPEAGPGQVRVRVTAIAVSPTDTGLREGHYGETKSGAPHVPGMDAAGVVDQVGEGSRWSVGDEVMGMTLPQGDHGGAYVQYLIAPDDSITTIPAGSTIEEASTVPMNGLTATQILERADLQPGQTIAVTGAAGLLGNYVVQLAKLRGLTVIADAAEKDRELVASLGADHIVERGDDVADRIREIAPDGVDAIADTALLHEKAVPALRDGGAFVAVRGWTGEPARDIRFETAFVHTEYLSNGKLEALRQAVETGRLTPRVAGVLPAERAADAHRRLAEGGLRGRLVLTF